MNIFISNQINEEAITLLKEKYNVEVWKEKSPPSKEFWLNNIHKYDGIIIMLSDKIDQAILQKADALKVISNYAVGTNNIDVKEARKKNILIGHTPDLLTEATAELTLALLLCLSRKILQANNAIKEGKWKKWEPNGYLGYDLQDKTLGIIGMGRIGQCFANKCKALYNMHVLYVKQTQEDLSPFKQVELEELLKESDIVSVHCPLTEKTKNLFQKDTFRKMKKNSLFINTARGEIHNEKDLIEALNSKHLWGAALDVTNPEPMDKSSLLLHHENIVITPHIGSATTETRKMMAILAAQNITEALEKNFKNSRYLK